MVVLVLLYLHLQIHTGRVHHLFGNPMAFWSSHIRRALVLYLACVGIAICVTSAIFPSTEGTTRTAQPQRENFSTELTPSTTYH